MKQLNDEQESDGANDPIEQDDCSVILNGDAQFENREIDPGFSPVPQQGDQQPEQQPVQQQQKKQQVDTSNELESAKNQGLAELDGTNPGSNAHPMDEDQPF